MLFSLITRLLTSGFIPCMYLTSISHPGSLKTHPKLQAAPNDDYLQFWVFFFLVRYSLLCLSSHWEIYQCTVGQFGDQSKPNSWICAQANLRKGVGGLPCPHIHFPSATQLISKSWLLISTAWLSATMIFIGDLIHSVIILLLFELLSMYLLWDSLRKQFLKNCVTLVLTLWYQNSS